MSTWLFVVTDRYGTPVAELQNASGPRAAVIPLNRVPNGAFTVRTDNALSSSLRSVDQALLKTYRNGVLLAHGPLVPGYQKQVQEPSRTIQVSWAGVGWRMGHRLIEASKSATGVTYGDPNNPASYMDRGAMAASIINGLNGAAPPAGVAQSAMDTGIRVGATPATSSTAVGPWYYKNALQAISELSATLDGFDWQIAPTEPTVDATGLQLGTFSCAQAFGATRADVWFEYGDGKHNVSSFTEQVDYTGALNRGYSLPTGFPSTPGNVLTTFDAPSIAAGGILYEDVVASDLVTDDMRTKLLNENIKVRKAPKTVITFQPTVEQQAGVVPSYGTDYVVGDLVNFRAVEYGVETINGLFRVYQVSFAVDDNGMETATPTLISQD